MVSRREGISWLTTYSQDGKVTKDRQLDKIDVAQALPDASGQMLVIGETISQNINRKGRIVLMDAQGQTKWEFDNGQNRPSQFTKVITSNADGFLIAGRQDFGFKTENDGWSARWKSHLYRFSADGKLVWQHAFDEGQSVIGTVQGVLAYGEKSTSYKPRTDKPASKYGGLVEGSEMDTDGAKELFLGLYQIK
jgi:hypothetical protein